jgi:hypothetical protein
MVKFMNHKTKFIKVLSILLPFLVAILILTPRLASPQFGLLDDPVMLAQSKTLIQGNFDLTDDFQSGRFRPLYWIIPALFYHLVGLSPFLYFLGFLILLFIILIQIRVLLKFQNASNTQILIACLAFLFSIPVIENFYTLTKGEPLQLAFILMGLIGFEWFKRKDAIVAKVGSAALVVVCLLAAAFVKETAIVMMPIAAVWLVFIWLREKKWRTKSVRNALTLFLLTLGVTALFFLMRQIWGTAAISEGTYTHRYGLALNELLANVARWGVQLSFYFPYLLPVVILIILFSVWRKKPWMENAMVLWVIWSLGWLGVLIPWGFAETYYLLPFGLGVAITIGLFVPKVIQHLAGFQKPKKITLLTLLGITFLLWLITLPNYVTSARMQLLIDRINQQMISDTAERLPNGGRALVNIQVDNEYVYNIELSLRNRYGRRDIIFNNVDSNNLDSLMEMVDTLLLVPKIENQPNLTVRMGVQESTQDFWNDQVIHRKNIDLDRIEQFQGEFRLMNINLPVLACPLIGEVGFCTDPDPLIDTRTFSYGWDIYQIK